jgi:hypothetical protein
MKKNAKILSLMLAVLLLAGIMSACAPERRPRFRPWRAHRKQRSLPPKT